MSTSVLCCCADMGTRLLISLLALLVATIGVKVSVIDHGAVGDGQTLCTKAFASAVAAVAASGGGVLHVPDGDYLTGPVELASNLILWLDSGATLHADTVISRLPVLPPLPSYGPRNQQNTRRRRPRTDLREGVPRFQALLYGSDLWNVTIGGENGTLDGYGETWWQRWPTAPLEATRPHLVEFVRSRGIQIRNVTLRNAGFWTVHFWFCEYVTVQFLTVLVMPWDSPTPPFNTDGVNPDSSSHVLIEDSYLQTGNDGVAIKSGWDCFGQQFAAPSRNITIRRLTVRQTRGNARAGVAIGSEMSGGVEDVLIEDCVFFYVGAAVEVKTGSSRGGYVRNVLARRLMIFESNRAALAMTAKWNNPNPFCVDTVPSLLPVIHDVVFEDVDIYGPTHGHSVLLEGTPDVRFRSVGFRRVRHAHGGQGSGGWKCRSVSGWADDNFPFACKELEDQPSIVAQFTSSLASNTSATSHVLPLEDESKIVSGRAPQFHFLHVGLFLPLLFSSRTAFGQIAIVTVCVCVRYLVVHAAHHTAEIKRFGRGRCVMLFLVVTTIILTFSFSGITALQDSLFVLPLSMQDPTT